MFRPWRIVLTLRKGKELLAGWGDEFSAGEPVFQEARAPTTVELNGAPDKIITYMMRVLILFSSR